MAKSNAAVDHLINDTGRFLETLERVQATFAARPKTREQKLVSALALDGQFPDRSGVVRPGIFGQLRRGEAAWNYLYLAGVPQTTSQIWAATEGRGKCKSKAVDGLKATYSSLYHSEKFRRYGLKHWTIT